MLTDLPKFKTKRAEQDSSSTAILVSWEFGTETWL